MPHQIIALCGYKETGKSTLAQHLVSTLQDTWAFLGEHKVLLQTRTESQFGIVNAPYSFADSIKLSLAPTIRDAINYEIRFGLCDSEVSLYSECTPNLLYALLYGNMKNYPLAALGRKTPRQLMQQYGTDTIRGHNDRFWVDTTFTRVYSALTRNGMYFNPGTDPDAYCSVAVIDDLREMAELTAMAELCEKTGVIYTPIALTRHGVGLSDTHSSETVVTKTIASIVKLYPGHVVDLRSATNPKSLMDPCTLQNVQAVRSIILQARPKTKRVRELPIEAVALSALSNMKSSED